MREKNHNCIVVAFFEKAPGQAVTFLGEVEHSSPLGRHTERAWGRGIEKCGRK